jgi:prepilin-type N-terminal cleavage/methylation domain-containing protein
MGQKTKGFSLMELLIVVAIILIIAAIAIPNLIRSRIAANNSAAASVIRSINTAQATYVSTYTTQGYADDLTKLGPGTAPCAAPHPDSTNACLLDFVLGCTAQPCTRDAFRYNVAGVGSGPPFDDYVVYGFPVGFGMGSVDYCSSSDEVIRSQADDAAANTTPITSTSTCKALPPI